MEELGGNPNVVICEPEIKSFKIQEEHDFIVLACKKNKNKIKKIFLIISISKKKKLFYILFSF
jgi:hypothetical protein